MRMPAEAFLLCLLLPPPPPPSKTRPTYTAAVISAQRQPRRPSDRRGGGKTPGVAATHPRSIPDYPPGEKGRSKRYRHCATPVTV
ncbi:MAG: hypothetical protein J3Q66DRAFT_341102 [Benniella sp.]|nr:MAG: hypothetical protein J3Q66DRAFT_341102 [Benniella sp.]